MAKMHWLIHTRIYRIWADMKTRCYNKKYKEYHRYGGKGINVCAEWKNDFLKFFDWAMTNEIGRAHV
jgi:hypothetical protein